MDGGAGLAGTSTAQLAVKIEELEGNTEFALQCPYAKCCWDFASSLKLSPQLWNHSYDRCYCNTCSGALAAGAEPEPEPEDAETGGSGQLSPEDRAEQLNGWVHFGLKLDEARVAARGAWDWDTAFHGTTADAFSKIVETGYLLVPGDYTPEGIEIGVRDGHIETGVIRDGRKPHEARSTIAMTTSGTPISEGVPHGEGFEPHKMVFTTPSLAYAAHDVYAQPAKHDSRSAKAVLKLKQLPASHPFPPEPEDGGTGPTT